MSIDEEKPEFAFDIANEAERSFQAVLMKATSSAAMALLEATQNVPLGIGVLLTELGTGLAIKRTNARMKDMFDHFSNQIRDIGGGN
jgi:hypothetical protein